MILLALAGLLAAAPVSWGQGRQAFVDPQAIAEIEPSAAGAAALRELDPKAVVQPGSPRVSLWQLSGATSEQVLAALEAKLPGHFAPVLHDERSPASKLRVPAGGVLVWLEASIDPAGWAEQRRLAVKQDFGRGLLLLESAPGAATLSLAAALRADKRVKTVMPNWWLRAVRR
ncbi:MAG: hypothetical protein H6Q89_4277 [Myxococcaceae bacterium]|nr:hypothetical protein [Myxococcaceae bacterium]